MSWLDIDRVSGIRRQAKLCQVLVAIFYEHLLHGWPTQWLGTTARAIHRHLAAHVSLLHEIAIPSQR